MKYKRMVNKTLLTVLAAAVVGLSCGKKVELPSQFTGLNPAAQEYILAGMNYSDSRYFKEAAELVSDSVKSDSIIAFGAEYLFEESGKQYFDQLGSIGMTFLELEDAIKMEKNDSIRDVYIKEGLRRAKFCEDRNLGTGYMAFYEFALDYLPQNNTKKAALLSLAKNNLNEAARCKKYWPDEIIIAKCLSSAQRFCDEAESIK